MSKYGFRAFCPKAVLFDMDGVLYDSMPLHARSWHDVMQFFGIAMRPEQAYEYEGMRGVETIRLLAKQQWGRDISAATAEEMYRKKTELFASCQPANMMSGIMNVMDKCRAHDLTVGVVTGSGQPSLLRRIENDFHGFISTDHIVTSFDVTHGKPSPEPYLQGLKKLGVMPYEAIVVENAPLGVRSAKAAQIFTVAVNTGPLADELLANEGADLIFRNMHDFADSFSEIIRCSVL